MTDEFRRGMEEAARLNCSNCADPRYTLVFGTTAHCSVKTYRHEAHGCRCPSAEIWKKLSPDVPQVSGDYDAPLGFRRVAS
jgi:hypothetical protein